MEITAKSWNEYKTKMSQISQKAADLMQEWVDKNGFEDRKALIEYGNALVMHYGSASGTLACEMYEKTAAAQGKTVRAAEMADLPSYGEVAKAINGTMKQTKAKVPSTVGRLTKQVGADTTLKNGMRDRAEFAWVPSGAETCAFCITLASRGWQRISKKTLRNGHAEHIHAGCDCQYSVRFDGSSNVEGYDPDAYYEMYENAEGKTPKDKINALRRALHQQKELLNKSGNDKMSIQKKIASANKTLDRLKAEFESHTGYYTYEQWYKDFDSVADGFGGYEDDPDCIVLSDIEAKIKAVERSKRNLLAEKPKRAQLEAGYPGRISDDELSAFNEKGLLQIKEDTGLDESEAKTIHDSLLEYFGGDYDAILKDTGGKAKNISDALDLMPAYDGSIYRGLTLTRDEASAFLNMKAGDKIPRKSNISSWSSNSRVADSFGGFSDYERTSIILECDNNKTGVGVQHLSRFGIKEAEVLSNANYEVVDISTENKYDYLATHKEYLYFEDDLETMSKELKENVVCKIKVREIS